MPPEAQGMRPHTADEAHPVAAVSGGKADAQHAACLRRSDSSLFWRALALPYRGGVAPRSRDAAPAAPETAAAAAAAASQALGRPRTSLDALGPSCSLGAETPQQRLSDGRESSGSEAGGGDAGLGGENGAVVQSGGAGRQQHSGAALSGAADGKQRPMRLNAHGSAAALRSSNPIRKVRPEGREQCLLAPRQAKQRSHTLAVLPAHPHR